MDNITFPSFWKDKPALWFSQVEAVFALNDIKLDIEKYDYILSILDKSILILIEDIVLGTEETNEEYESLEETKYYRLKHEIIKRLSISALEKEVMGELKPSEFYEHLKHKADPSICYKTIRRIWFDGLPKYLKEILVVDTSDETEAENLIADKIVLMVKSQKLVPEVDMNTKNVEEKVINSLQSDISTLIEDVNKLKILYLALLSHVKRKISINANQKKS